ncbi:MAG: 3-hydroxyacyl-CoA dehydrogenase family protein [Bryobacteraceae bacterium]
MYKFDTAAVIGSGMMGPGIALTLALGGVRSTILSRTEENAAAGLRKAHDQIDLLEANDLVEGPRAGRAHDLMDASTEFDRVIANVDLVIESAPENMEFKQDLFARMDALVSPPAILASNTSGLSITAVASRCRHPERVLTAHFWNPPHLMPLVELVKGERTDPNALTALRDLLAHCGKVPVVVNKDRPGQLGNRMQMALVREAVNIVAEGIASVEDVDTAARCGFGLRLPVYGVLEHQDMVGIDMGFSIVDYVSKDLFNEPHAPPLMKQKLEAGELGVKTGKGFYDWSVKSAPEVRARRDAFVLDCLKRFRQS